MEVSVNITKEDFDLLYHLLRKFSNSGDEFRESVEDIFVHLFKGPQYCHLLAYSEFYGKKYLLPEVISTIEKLYPKNEFKRVVDLGCGRGWLGYGIAHHFNACPVLIDKRETVGKSLEKCSIIYHNVDLETEAGVVFLRSVLQPRDLIVMCDFLHCIDNPKELLEMLASWPMVILEYTSQRNYNWLSSYYIQLGRYGATAYNTEQLARMVREATGKTQKCMVVEPYLLVATGGGKCSG